MQLEVAEQRSHPDSCLFMPASPPHGTGTNHPVLKHSGQTFALNTVPLTIRKALSYWRELIHFLL